MLSVQKLSIGCSLVASVVIGGCGSSHSGATAGGSPSPSQSGTSTGNASSAAGALSADARSAATGDIPDNQVFLVFTNRAAGYSIKYPEGWTQSGSGPNVSFRDKNNLVHVLISHGAPPTPSAVASELGALKRSDPTLTFQAPRTVKIGSGSAVKVVYTTESPPNPVTGKRVKLLVDRYELARAGRIATVDLGTPVGVDNVDAYRMMIASFRWP